MTTKTIVPSTQWQSFLLPTIGAILLRSVAFAYFGDYLEDNTTFVAPWNSFQRLRDGVALWRNEIGLYAGEFHSVPWVAILFAPLVEHRLATLIVFTLFDLLAGFVTYMFTLEFLLGKDKRPEYYAILAYTTYVLNPMGVGVCAVCSLSSFVNLLLSLALYANFKGRCFVSTILISLVAQLNVYYIILLMATIHRRREQTPAVKSGDQNTKIVDSTFPIAADHSLGSISFRLIVAVGLYMANGMFVKLGDIFNGNIMFFLKVEDQTPNVGIFWYMFTQVFAHYRLFFLCIFQIIAFVYVFPLWQLMKKKPFSLWFVYLQVISIVSSYPTYAEFCVYLPLFFSFVEYHQYYSITYLIGTALLVSMTTSVITLTQWLQTGSGNANFYFGSCCTYILALIALVRETIYAHIVHEHVQQTGDSDPKAYRYFHDTSPLELEAKSREAAEQRTSLVEKRQ